MCWNVWLLIAKLKKNLRSENKLTDSLIKELTIYFCLTIRRNTDSVENMIGERQVTYWHKVSTENKLKHEQRAGAGGKRARKLQIRKKIAKIRQSTTNWVMMIYWTADFF